MKVAVTGGAGFIGSHVCDVYRDNIYALIAALEATPPDVTFMFVSSCAVGLSDSPYAATKRLGEELTRSYQPKRGKVIRLVSCVGEGYSHGHIKDFVSKAKNGEPIIPLDDGRYPKSFVHVRDAAEAIVNQATNYEVYQGLDIVGAAMGKPREEYTVAAGSWSWRDTLAMMGIKAERWEEKTKGWRGDPVGLRVDSSWHCQRSVGEGVREALVSLGWDR